MLWLLLKGFLTKLTKHSSVQRSVWREGVIFYYFVLRDDQVVCHRLRRSIRSSSPVLLCPGRLHGRRLFSLMQEYEHFRGQSEQLFSYISFNRFLLYLYSINRLKVYATVTIICGKVIFFFFLALNASFMFMLIICYEKYIAPPSIR